jgi:hypothetical protein
LTENTCFWFNEVAVFETCSLDFASDDGIVMDELKASASTKAIIVVVLRHFILTLGEGN